MTKIYKTMKIEDFLKMANDMESTCTHKGQAEKLRKEYAGAQQITIKNGIVKIVRGVYAGTKGELINQFNDTLCVKIVGDKYYNNTVKININDIECEDVSEAAIVYILE